MAIENFKTPDVQETGTEFSPEEIDDLKDELPVTKAEAEEAADVLMHISQPILEEAAKVERPIKLFGETLERGVNTAKLKGFIKWDKKDEEMRKNLRNKFADAIQANMNQFLSIQNTPQKYYLNPDGLFNWINSLEKKERKFVKKTLESVIKSQELQNIAEVGKGKANTNAKTKADIINEKIN